MSTLPGIDKLIRTDFKALQDRKVGLITNHTGLTAAGLSTIDVLHQAPGVELAALFGPEHGIRGEMDAKVADGRDAKTGLPVYSLYGDNYRPTSRQLSGLNALVYDIQDIGCRFYTFSSTLGHCLAAAGEAGIEMVVLDRPNPITGDIVEGPIADPDRLSFTAFHTIPVRHGLTMGEFARMLNEERKFRAKLTVINCDGWRRRMWWDATGLTWVNPSPNMRSLTQATLYPGIGLLETTNLSVGRGTDTPFEVIGAPWMDGRGFAESLNRAAVPGFVSVPVTFTPRSSVFAGRKCGGIHLIITNRERFSPVLLGITIAVLLRKLYRDAWQAEKYANLLANRKAQDRLMNGAGAEELRSTWRSDIDKFYVRRRNYLLYR